MLQAFRSFIGENQMMAYLVMMAVRLNSESTKAAGADDVSYATGFQTSEIVRAMLRLSVSVRSEITKNA